MQKHPPAHRSCFSPRAYAAVAAYLLGFAALLTFVCYYYLFPALAAVQHANRKERKILAAHSMLILALVLFILLVGLILTFRIGRFFFPRHRAGREVTQYEDAWAESGRRMELRPERPDE